MSINLDDIRLTQAEKQQIEWSVGRYQERLQKLRESTTPEEWNILVKESQK